MTDENFEVLKVSLHEQKKQILEKLAADSKEFKAILDEMDSKDFADAVSDYLDRDMLEVMGTQELKRLRAIDAALNRIGQGKYGKCMKCGKKIPAERLKAIPYAVLCIDCQKSQEKPRR